MGLLQQIQAGRAPMPPRIMVYGTEGIGKSTIASRAPKPIFVQTEDGLGEIDCHKFPLARSLDDVHAGLAELLSEQHDYQTVVVDSLDWLERMIWDALCKNYGVSSIEKVDGGYGKGYVHALGSWRRVVDQLALVREQRNMMVVLLAHAKVERFEDPEETAYDRYSPRLNKHAGALISEWCDAVLFATRKIVTRHRNRRLQSHPHQGRGRRQGRRRTRASLHRRALVHCQEPLRPAGRDPAGLGYSCRRAIPSTERQSQPTHRRRSD